ncbi:cell cycle checkpoint control protein RAD9A [Neocloeon triangulifer]|uniref:cell cycle checkpoint control protein RAD9A n=1 Tax=Neocloeon triangulifer TaxID=2078957 RepID=UPI00286F8D4A|nr:cell cycle checkpoint control protein RAD9A [Neocloeon triangulifer]
MKCHIPSANVKVLGKAIQTLSKIGDELYVEPYAGGIHFRTVDSRRAAFASFNFDRSFFIHYSPTNRDHQPSSSQSQAAEPELCKVPMKSCLAAFRTHNVNVEMCKIFFANHGQGGRVLVFQLCCRHSICKTYYVPVIQTESLQAHYNKDSTKNKLIAQSKLLIDALHSFNKNQDDITISVSSSRVILRNFTDASEAMKNTMRTELALESSEFDALQIGVETTITFNLRELRALLSFAEACNITVSGHFDTPGRPIVFCVTNQPSFEAQFVLATMTYNDTLSQSQSVSSQRSSSQRSFNDTVVRRRPSTTVEQSQATLPRAPTEPPATPRPEIAAQIDMEIEEIQQLQWEEDEEPAPPVGTPPEIRAQKFYFPRCFREKEVESAPQTLGVILAYDSDGEN